MRKSEIEYLSVLVERLKGYKSPTDAQQLIILLAEKGDQGRTSEDNKKLSTLLKAEKQAEKLAEARAEARALLDAEKRKAKKLEDRKKIIWGGAFRKFAGNDADAIKVMQDMFMSGYISDRDKELLNDDFNAIIDKFNSNMGDR